MSTPTIEAAGSREVSAESLTPTIGATARRWLFWIGAGALAIVIVVITLATVGSGQRGAPLDPENAAPTGTMAVAEVLRDQGVSVTVTRSLAETRRAATDPSATTLVIHDANLILVDDQLAEAVGLADTVILLEPGFAALEAVAPEIANAGGVSGVLDADCGVGAVERAGTVSGEGTGYRVIDDVAEAVTCLGSGDDVYSLVSLDTGDGVLTVLGATGALTNGMIVEEGNAAFGLGLLGEHEELVWYLPGFDDLEPGDETVAELSPAWVVPVMVMLFVTAFLAAIWRGRRFGPLVVENLPVIVRASETMLGRSRLYSRSSSRLRALDSLRVGTIQRLATLCGLPRVATVEDVIAAVAGVTGAQVHDIRQLLVGAMPQTDRDLLAYSDALLVLERDVAARLRP